MLHCFRCPPETKNDLDALVESGAYKDHGAAIAVAVSNLVLMEKEFASNGQIVIDTDLKQPSGNRHNVTSDSPAVVEAKKAPQEKKMAKRAKPTKKAVRAKDNGKSAAKKQPTTQSEPMPEPEAATLSELPKAPEVPSIFQRASLPESEPLGLSDLPADMWQPGQDIPLDRWILGQFNRLLPAKVNARALIHLFVREKKRLGVDEAAQMVANEALNLGDYLVAIDEKQRLSRDDSLSTAFPQRRKDREKGCTRYANQFVVYQNGRGELSGLMIDLKLINVEVHRRERRIVPTHIAWDFAKLDNPLLDDNGDGSVRKFSDEERDFLLDHIIRGVPAESFAYRVILEAVTKGNNTPEKIDGVLKRYVSEERAGELSQSFFTSQRSGAVSRMSDLELITRHREGVRVTYSVTKQGEKFLSHHMDLVEV